jgi:hypothetical protein
VLRYYEILQLKPGASPLEIQQAYRDLVRVWHPDRFAHDPRLQKIAEQRLKEINTAYIALEELHRETPPDEKLPSIEECIPGPGHRLVPGQYRSRARLPRFGLRSCRSLFPSLRWDSTRSGLHRRAH